MFMRVKSIKKNGKCYSYLYLVKNYWDKEKKGSRQKVILYMGKVIGMEPFKVNKILERDGAKCKLCGRQDTLTIDHIIPLSKGGSNNQKNLQILCEGCNKKKGKKIDENAKKKQGFRNDFGCFDSFSPNHILRF